LLFWPSFVLSLVVLFTPVYGAGEMRYLDKVVHVIMFGFLTWFALLKFSNRFWVGSLMIIYIASAEIIQEVCIPGRGLDIWDAVAGMLGLMFVFIAAKKIIY